MKTEEATERLARIWMGGGVSDAAAAIELCIGHSREWRWTEAGEAMAAAYRALGAQAPEVPVNAIHRGSHPVQVAAAAIERSAS